MSFLRSVGAASRLARSALSPTSTSSLAAQQWRQSGPAALSFARHLSDQARRKIDGAVKADPLVIFMKGTPEAPMCGFSRAVCQIMQVQGVKEDKMKTYNCLEDEELRQGIKEYSDWPTIPQVYLNGEFIGGCDIMLNMHQSGELEAALDKAGVLHPVQQQPAGEKA